MCRRTINTYRFIVMNHSMKRSTWTCLLKKLLIISNHMISPANEELLPDDVIKMVAETLMVTFVRACLLSQVSVGVWDMMLSTMKSLLSVNQVMQQWASALDMLTKTLAFVVYKVDLAALSSESTKGENGVNESKMRFKKSMKRTARQQHAKTADCSSSSLTSSLSSSGAECNRHSVISASSVFDVDCTFSPDEVNQLTNFMLNNNNNNSSGNDSNSSTLNGCNEGVRMDGNDDTNIVDINKVHQTNSLDANLISNDVRKNIRHDDNGGDDDDKGELVGDVSYSDSDLTIRSSSNFSINDSHHHSYHILNDINDFDEYTSKTDDDAHSRDKDDGDTYVDSNSGPDSSVDLSKCNDKDDEMSDDLSDLKSCFPSLQSDTSTVTSTNISNNNISNIDNNNILSDISNVNNNIINNIINNNIIINNIINN
ncbi:hypothetical protein HELRODRAFT_162341 [Helobdella robusta]|uniref:Ral GTPase-activating protein subunit alpha/beta N-terminal domain-containing protein n=1 Tax=Helobdella robusta TaxID=6412 RepID=T1ESI9_HELRO|nr:hypothetical protein HELRODRAFT_162341 [Helobdella robusta]ESN98878.1 hypothetical protein HELRODRAFT_162341 [Helobdella robusta]